MAKKLIINGRNIQDIPSFYEEINRVFMTNESWKLGQNLDALNDLFYGGYGEIDGKEDIVLVWQNFEENSKSLGSNATKEFYLHKLNFPSLFNTEFVQGKLAELERGTGQTFFDIVLEIIEEHPNIHLIAC